jgi:OCRE domain
MISDTLHQPGSAERLSQLNVTMSDRARPGPGCEVRFSGLTPQTPSSGTSRERRDTAVRRALVNLVCSELSLSSRRDFADVDDSLVRCREMRDRESGLGRGHGFAEFDVPDFSAAAVRASAKLNSTSERNRSSSKKRRRSSGGSNGAAPNDDLGELQSAEIDEELLVCGEVLRVDFAGEPPAVSSEQEGGGAGGAEKHRSLAMGSSAIQAAQWAASNRSAMPGGGSMAGSASQGGSAGAISGVGLVPEPGEDNEAFYRRHNAFAEANGLLTLDDVLDIVHEAREEFEFDAASNCYAHPSGILYDSANNTYWYQPTGQYFGYSEACGHYAPIQELQAESAARRPLVVPTDSEAVPPQTKTTDKRVKRMFVLHAREKLPCFAVVYCRLYAVVVLFLLLLFSRAACQLTGFCALIFLIFPPTANVVPQRGITCSRSRRASQRGYPR